MAAGYQNLKIEQGCTFRYTLSISNDANELTDLTGYTAVAVMRMEFDSDVNKYVLTCTIPNSETIVMALTATQTDAIQPGRYWYDLRISKDGTVTRILEGIIQVSPTCQI